MPELISCLDNNKLKLISFVESINSRYLSEKELLPFGNLETMFFNVNDMAALIRAREMYGG
jgi:hypothetical protein